MSTQLLLAVDLLLVVGGTAAFLTAGVLTVSIRTGPGRGRPVAAAATAVAGLALCAARVAVDLLVAGRGWWFAGEKVLLGLPLAVLTAGLGAAVGLPFAVRAARGRVRAERRPAAAASLLIAGYGAAAGILLTFFVGYPVSVAAAGGVLALVAGVSGLTWVVLTRSGSPGVRAFLVLVCVLPVLAIAGLAFYRTSSPSWSAATARVTAISQRPVRPAARHRPASRGCRCPTCGPRTTSPDRCGVSPSPRGRSR